MLTSAMSLMRPMLSSILKDNEQGILIRELAICVGVGCSSLQGSTITCCLQHTWGYCGSTARLKMLFTAYLLLKIILFHVET